MASGQVLHASRTNASLCGLYALRDPLRPSPVTALQIVSSQKRQVEQAPKPGQKGTC